MTPTCNNKRSFVEAYHKLIGNDEQNIDIRIHIERGIEGREGASNIPKRTANVNTQYMFHLNTTTKWILQNTSEAPHSAVVGEDCAELGNLGKQGVL